MKKNSPVKIFVALLAMLCICIHSFSPFACAIISKNGTISLNVADSDTGVPLENATFRLYFFAAAYEKQNGVGYSYVVPYDDCKMDMDNLQDAYLPIHLTHFAKTHALPYSEKSSDENGHLIFENLVPGVYLIVPAHSREDYFTPSPFVINIPLYDNENKNWVYDINATPKMRIYSGTEDESFTYISVKKIWDVQNAHPEKVTVSLLKDFTAVQTVELNEANNWSYRWDNLSAKHTWSVVENVPYGYTVSYVTSSNTVTVINKASSPETTQPGDTTTHSPTQPSENEQTTKPDELIHTGQLNWPVPVLSVSGLLLFSIGWAMLNLSKKDEETE
ncbi:MAG: Cna B-type domain-containing protein [Clostridia bacterium]|nr:Cna B-type domain-containing protein [Clostridia bacterium]